MPADDFKLKAAEAALAHVQSGMRLGLGTGSTAAKFVDLVGQKVKGGLDVLCVATSEATAQQARALGIRLTTLDDITELDLAVDGADEISEDCHLIKGGGGALLREKIVAHAAQKFIVIADHTKLVDELGRFPLPVEVVQFGLKTTMAELELLLEGEEAAEVKLRLRADGKPFITDNGNFILDCKMGLIDDPFVVDAMLKSTPGVVEHGLFLQMTDVALIAGPGGIREVEPSDFDLMMDDMDDVTSDPELARLLTPKKKR